MTFPRTLTIILLAAMGCLLPVAPISVLCAAVLLLYLPGRLVIHLLSPLDSAAGRSWMAVSVSLVLMPVPLAWVWRMTNERVWILVSILGVNLLPAFGLWARRRLASRGGVRAGDRAPAAGDAVQPATMFVSSRARGVFAALVAWLAAWTFASFWIPTAFGRNNATSVHDYIKHHAVLLSLDRDPLPLRNMFYAGEPETPYYYYEYPYYIPAALRILSGRRMPIHVAFGLVAALSAAALCSLVYLAARRHGRSDWGGVLATACIGVVGGWDIVAVALRWVLTGKMVVTLDAWCPVAWRIHNFATQYAWCPQHVTAIIALAVAATWARRAPHARWWVLMAPLLGASIFGSSVYLAIPIFAGAVIYVLAELGTNAARRGGVPRGRLLMGIVAIAALGAALMLPQALGYRDMAARYDGGLTTQWERFPLAVLGRVLPPGPLANWLDAPWILLVDLGLPLVALLSLRGEAWRALWRDRGMRLLMLGAAAGGALVFTFRSDINPIDYGFRIALMPGMVVGAVAAGMLVDAGWVRPWCRRWRVAIVVTGVALGSAVGLYEVPLRAARTLIERQTIAGEADAVRFIRDQLPVDSVVQGDPERRDTLAMLTDRRSAVLNPENPHVVVFRPRDAGAMRRRYEEVLQAFAEPDPPAAHRRLGECGADYVYYGAIERDAGHQRAQFEDPEWFTPVYRDEVVTVYHIRHEPIPSDDETARDSRSPTP
jgi:hypothetical protein